MREQLPVAVFVLRTMQCLLLQWRYRSPKNLKLIRRISLRDEVDASLVKCRCAAIFYPLKAQSHFRTFSIFFVWLGSSRELILHGVHFLAKRPRNSFLSHFFWRNRRGTRLPHHAPPLLPEHLLHTFRGRWCALTQRVDDVQILNRKKVHGNLILPSWLRPSSPQKSWIKNGFLIDTLHGIMHIVVGGTVPLIK